MLISNIIIKFQAIFLLKWSRKYCVTLSEIIFEKTLNQNGYNQVSFINLISTDSMLNTANKLVHFGWKNEAIPVTSSKKSKIRRFFDAIFVNCFF